jgi:beta-phosphoglucomutase-like phosphatase (HAD superfamily)
MKGTIFDLHGVIVDSMPMHYEAWMIAFSRVVNIEANERTVYSLEGMRVIQLVKKILMRTGLKEFVESIAIRITKRKDEHFTQVFRFKPLERVNELVTNLRCRKALISGSSKKDFGSMLDHAIGFGNEQFDVMICADDATNRKTDSSSLLLLLQFSV